ncbi:unnamed protein product, partial [Heterosigma akashiwo]
MQPLHHTEMSSFSCRDPWRLRCSPLSGVCAAIPPQTGDQVQLPHPWLLRCS